MKRKEVVSMCLCVSVFSQQKKIDLFVEYIWASNICSTKGCMRQLVKGIAHHTILCRQTTHAVINTC